MGKGLLAALLLVAIVVGVVSGTTFAYFSATSSAGTITISTGNADLCLSKDGSDWRCGGPIDAAELGLIFPTGIHPGYVNEAVGTIYVGNLSSSPISLDATLSVTDYGEDPEGLGSVILLKTVWDGDDTGTGWVALTGDGSWEGRAADLFGEPIPQGQSRALTFQLQMSGDAGNDLGGGEATFNLLFNGVQAQ